MKKCRECKVEQPEENYWKVKSNEEKTRDVCKECYKQRARKRSASKKRDLTIIFKKCTRCHLTQSIDSFSKNINTKDGFSNHCRTCKKLEYYNMSDLEKNKRRMCVRKWHNEKVKTDPLYKLQKRMRGIVLDAMRKKGYSKTTKTFGILGCTKEELLNHLNNNTYRFQYGCENLEIDHIIPLSSATTEEELSSLNHYTNLQLLPSAYNQHIKKNNPWDKDHFESWLKENPYKTKNENNGNINI